MMERAVVMVRHEQRQKLEKLAAQEHVSAAEINRRAIDAYNPGDRDNQELEQLALIAIQSNHEAMQALKEARKAIKDTLVNLKKGKG